MIAWLPADRTLAKPAEDKEDPMKRLLLFLAITCSSVHISSGAAIVGTVTGWEETSNIPGFTPLADLNLQPGTPIYGVFDLIVIEGSNIVSFDFVELLSVGSTGPVLACPGTGSLGTCTGTISDGTIQSLQIWNPQSHAGIASNTFHDVFFDYLAPESMVFSFHGWADRERLPDGTEVNYNAYIYGLGIVTPEPGTWVLMSLALGLGLVARRRGQRARMGKRPAAVRVRVS